MLTQKSVTRPALVLILILALGVLGSSASAETPANWETHEIATMRGDLRGLAAGHWFEDSPSQFIVMARGQGDEVRLYGSRCTDNGELRWMFIDLPGRQSPHDAAVLPLNNGEQRAIFYADQDQDLQGFLTTGNTLDFLISTQTPQQIDFGYQATSLASADFTGSGSRDLLLGSNSGKGDILLLSPPPAFWLPSQWDRQVIAQQTSAQGFAMLDIDGDGDLDPIALTREEAQTQLLFLTNPGAQGNPAGAWEKDSLKTAAGWASGLVSTNLVNPHLPAPVALATCHLNGQICFYYQNSDWQGVEYVNVNYLKDAEAANRIHGIQSADLDNDGVPEIIVSQRIGQDTDKSQSVFITFPATLKPGTNITPDNATLLASVPGQSHGHFRALDVDGDGDIDLVSAERLPNKQIQVHWHENPVID